MFCHTKLKRFLSAAGAPLSVAEIQWRDAFCSNAYRCYDHWKSKCTWTLKITHEYEREPAATGNALSRLKYSLDMNELLLHCSRRLKIKYYDRQLPIYARVHFQSTKPLANFSISRSPSPLSIWFFVSFLFFSPPSSLRFAAAAN